MENRFIAEKFEAGRWVKSESPGPPGGVIYKDFLPQPDPDRSSCCTRQYSTFSETVQQANEWLGGHEGAQVLACETLPFVTNSPPSVYPPHWPTATQLGGLRVWLKIPTYDEETGTGEKLPGRALLSYRDFSPRLSGKSVFSKGYEDTNVLLGRVNEYLRDRVTPARILSVQTLDTPLEGVVDVGADTEKSRISYAQHGFTRYCRSLRVFSVTRYHHGPLQGPAPRIRLRLKDFTPKTEARSERLTDLIKRALQWFAMRPTITVLNIQVIPLRAGVENSAASTWLLESPGHIINKFSSFVRVIYTSNPSDDSEEPPTSPLPQIIEEANETQTAVTPIGDENAEDAGEEEQKEEAEAEAEESGGDSGVSLDDSSSLPGAIKTAPPITTTGVNSPIIHCKTFVPRQVSKGGFWSSAEWESVDQMTGRLNAWVSASQGTLVTLHTHLVYASADEIRPEETRWARPMRHPEQVGVLHAVVQGGRPPTALPAPPPLRSEKCSIM